MTLDERKKGAGAALAGVGVGAIGAWLLSGKVSAAPPGIDPKLWEALLALISAVDAQTQAINQLIAELPEQLVYQPVPNTGGALCSRVDIIAAGAPGVLQLPNIPVPDDMALVVKSWPTNPVGGFVYVAGTAADAASPFSSWPLVPNEPIALRVNNADILWVSASIVPAIVVCITEVRR